VSSIPALLRTPPLSLDQHSWGYQDLREGRRGALERHRYAVTHTRKRVVGYGFKAIPRGSAIFDSLLILPRALSEVKDSQWETGARTEWCERSL
jgi:hypothetical protein